MERATTTKLDLPASTCEEAEANSTDEALVQLARLLARQAARELIGSQREPDSAEKPNPNCEKLP